MTYKKKEQLMGRLIVSLGLLLKTIQIIGAAFSVEALSGSFITLVTTCLLVGGFAVIAVEKICVTSIFASLSSVATLAGVLSILKPAIAFYIMAASFLFYGLTLISMKKKWRILCGTAVILLAVLLSLHTAAQLFTIPAPLITVILIAIYGVTGTGLYL